MKYKERGQDVPAPLPYRLALTHIINGADYL